MVEEVWKSKNVSESGLKISDSTFFFPAVSCLSTSYYLHIVWLQLVSGSLSCLNILFDVYTLILIHC